MLFQALNDEGMCSMKRISTQILKYSQIEKKCVLNSTYISFIEHYQVCSASYVRYNDDERRKNASNFERVHLLRSKTIFDTCFFLRADKKNSTRVYYV